VKANKREFTLLLDLGIELELGVGVGVGVGVGSGLGLGLEVLLELLSSSLLLELCDSLSLLLSLEQAKKTRTEIAKIDILDGKFIFMILPRNIVAKHLMMLRTLHRFSGFGFRHHGSGTVLDSHNVTLRGQV
jgi:hypothetical protein